MAFARKKVALSRRESIISYYARATVSLASVRINLCDSVIHNDEVKPRGSLYCAKAESMTGRASRKREVVLPAPTSVATRARKLFALFLYFALLSSALALVALGRLSFCKMTTLRVTHAAQSFRSARASKTFSPLASTDRSLFPQSPGQQYRELERRDNKC